MTHMHNVVDSDKRFIIEPLTREIKNESGKITLVQYDHNAERFTFEVPRLVEGHDMSLCDKVEIHYINIASTKEKSADVYPVNDLTVDEWDEDKVIFSWLISANATKYAGTLNFLIRFVCLNGETIEYAWNTAIFSGITIESGMDNGQAVIEEYSDVLAAWEKRVTYVLTDADKAEIAEAVKAQVPLVKSAEQPTFVSSVDKMTDTSKVYVMPDMSMWAWIEGTATARTFTADDFRYSENNSNGSLMNGYTRISTTNLIDLGAGTVSIECPSPYQYFVYYYTDNTEDTYVGKTAWKAGSIDDVLTDTIASGTKDGAKYCRISLRDNRNTTASLNGRMDEFMQNIIVMQKSCAVTAWNNTGHSYNQPANYEDRIVALERALEGIENGSF